MQPTTYNVNVYCAKHIPEHRFIHKSRTLFALFKITFIVLTPTALYEASRTSVRLKQWDEKHRQCAVFRLRESVCVYSVLGTGCRTLAAANSLEYLIGHALSVLLVERLVVQNTAVWWRSAWMAVSLTAGKHKRKEMQSPLVKNKKERLAILSYS